MCPREHSGVFARSLSVLGLVVLALGAASANGTRVDLFGSKSSTTTGAVIVEKTGWSQVFQGGRTFSVYSWGVVIANRSATLDAVGVTVTIAIYAGVLGEVDGRDYTIAAVPAGRRFYIGQHALIARTDVRISRISATVRVRAMQSKRRLLPVVSSIRLDKTNYEASAEVRNPYSTPLELTRATGYIVFFDRNGRVIGGNKNRLGEGRGRLAPRRRLRLEFNIEGVSIAHVARAEVSVNP
jgi:hypothetical protein